MNQVNRSGDLKVRTHEERPQREKEEEKGETLLIIGSDNVLGIVESRFYKPIGKMLLSKKKVSSVLGKKQSCQWKR